MPTEKARQYAQWLVDNQDKQGTPEWETVANAYQLAKGVSDVADQLNEGEQRRRGMPEDSALVRAENPAQDMTGLEKFVTGFDRGVTNIGRGLMDMVPPMYPGDPAPARREAEIAESRRLDEPLMKSGAAVAGDVVGNLATLGPLAAVPGANTYPGAAVAGAVASGVQPTTEDESRLANAALGAVTGVAARGGIDAIGAGGRAINNLALPYMRPAAAAGRVLDDAAGPRRQAVIDALRGNQRPLATAGQAATPAGSAEFSALQRMASRQAPSETVERAGDQAQRRLMAIRSALGGADEAAQARSARSAAVNPLYTSARASNDLVDVQRPVSLIRRIKARDPQNTRLVNVLDDVENSLADMDVNNLMSASRQIGNLMSEKGPTGNRVNEQIVRELRLIKRSLDAQIGRVSPDFRQANQVFQEMSRPVDQANIGQALMDALDPAINDVGGDVGQRATVFANALRNAPQTVKRATGFRRSPALDRLLTDRQMGVVNEVGADLANDVNFNSLAREGMAAAGDVLDDIAPGQIAPILERNVVIANALLGRSGKHGTRRIMEYLAEHMQDPQVIADIMERQAPESFRRELLRQLMQGFRTTAPIVAGSSSGG